MCSFRFRESAASLSDAELLAAFQEAGQVVNERLLKERPVLSSWSTVTDYLRSQMAFEPREQFRVLFLDKRNSLIADEVQGEGTVDHCPVYPREVLRRAIELGATALVIAHNHPSGDPTPSRADVVMTEQLAQCAKVLGIALHDHVIVGRDGNASLKGAGLLS